ncbi:hypothetical protein HHK36_000954 [Tetracentron sinense]|uniref:C2H2-type domain-containing protein n=1 Tax=Tetracentron sinense TaxID=13715 RepID=A0A835DUG8_TETSI|nr:hypothetical protein HHK36_000954 [Tetracentron sinense]
MAMVVVDDQQITSFKHFCRVCKKGFGCGRALGGHMRAHGIGDENGLHMEDEDPASDWNDKQGGGNKRMYALRTNPNRRLKSSRVCENCGKEFLSWKSFLEHGKCTSLISSPELEDEEDGTGGRGYGWSKGKRTRRIKMGNSNSNCPSSEEEDLANCLVMLSGARVDDPMVAEMEEESCGSASKEEERWIPDSTFTKRLSLSGENAKGIAKGMFECKACKKVFSSHQALGGHRASHKKVKGCFAAKLESLVEEDVIAPKSTSIIPFEPSSHDPTLVFPSERKSKVHECSICRRIFSSGQALGGHKRCHWVTSNSPDTSSLITKFQQFQDNYQKFHQTPKSEPLDLNQPAPTDDIAGVRPGSEDPLSLEVSTAIYLQPWISMDTDGNKDNHPNHHHHTKNTTTSNNNTNVSIHNVDDEAESKVKLAKLSDLKDMNLAGSSSPWLQVGIGSTTTNGGCDP